MVLSLDGPISRTVLDEAASRIEASAARLVALEADPHPPAHEARER